MENKINLTNYDGKMQLEYCFIVLQQTINLYINCWHDSIVGYQLLVYASALYIYIYIYQYIFAGWMGLVVWENILTAVLCLVFWCLVETTGFESFTCIIQCSSMKGTSLMYTYRYIHRYLIHLYIVDIWEYTVDISVDMQFPNNISMELNNIWWCTRVLFSHDVHVYIYIYWILWMDVGETKCYI